MDTIESFIKSIRGLSKDEKIISIKQKIINNTTPDILAYPMPTSYVSVNASKKNPEKKQGKSITSEQLNALLKEVEGNPEAYNSQLTNKELIPFIYDRSFDWYYNSQNIPYQDLVFETIEYFELGLRKGYYEPLEFLNLLKSQYDYVCDNIGTAHSTLQHLKALPITQEHKHILYGFILKWFGRVPNNNLSTQHKTTLKLIEKEFLAFEVETPEKNDYQKDWIKEEECVHFPQNLTKETDPKLFGAKAEDQSSTELTAQLIIFNTNETMDFLYEALKANFSGFEAEFKKALEGKRLSTPLLFPSNQNKFVEVFRRVKYNGYITSTPKEITQWLCLNFQFNKKGTITKFNKNSVSDLLTKAKGEPPKKERICLLDWLPYKSPGKLRTEANTEKK